MLKNVLAGVGVILGGAMSLLIAYGWGVDDGMYPEKNPGLLADTMRESFKNLRTSRD